MSVQSYQEARGVVQQTAEAADEASLQEGGVFRWKLLRVVAQQVRGGGRQLSICRQEELSHSERTSVTDALHLCGSDRRHFSGFVLLPADPHIMQHDRSVCVCVCEH